MYIYHVLFNALSAYMIHINLNTIFYTHAEHSPTKTIYMTIIMYIYHVLVNTLNAHMILINLNMIFYTHREPAQFHPNNPHKAPYRKTNNTPLPLPHEQNTMNSNVYNTHMHTRTHTVTHKALYGNTQTTINSNMYETDLYVCVRMHRAHAHTCARTHMHTTHTHTHTDCSRNIWLFQSIF